MKSSSGYSMRVTRYQIERLVFLILLGSGIGFTVGKIAEACS